MDDQIVTVVGAQWGDEGKGKTVDILAEKVDIVARYNGGANAGHTIVVGENKFAFHLVPSGILYDSVTCLLGNGVVIHLPSLFSELEALTEKNIDFKGRMLLSDRAHVLFDFHKVVDGLNEEGRGKSSLGTTKQGIGPCYSTKAQRTGIRVSDLKHFDKAFVPKFKRLVTCVTTQFKAVEVDLDQEIEKYRQYAETIKPWIVDSVVFCNEALKSGKKLLVEGANAVMLDLDFGTYPFVTSSSPSIGGACTGLGLPPLQLKRIIGVVKAYTTRVGAGPMATELQDEVGKKMLDVGHEYGTTTGRPRRCGWLDMVQLKYSHMINNYTDIALTKLDVMTGIRPIKVAVAYKTNGVEMKGFPACFEDMEENFEVVYHELQGWSEDISNVASFEELPPGAQEYVNFISKEMGVKVWSIGVGPKRNSTIFI